MLRQRPMGQAHDPLNVRQDELLGQVDRRRTGRGRKGHHIPRASHQFGQKRAAFFLETCSITSEALTPVEGLIGKGRCRPSARI